MRSATRRPEGRRQPRRADPTGLSACATVHRVLELAEQSHRFGIAERQKLHQQYGAHAALRIYPEIRIHQAGPGEASSRAPALVGSRVGEEAEGEAVAESGMEVHVERALQLDALESARLQR